MPNSPAAPIPDASQARRRAVGFACAIVGTLLFSAKPILIKLAYDEQATATTVLALRMAFSLPVYLVVGAIALRRHRPALTPGPVVCSAAIGILGYYGAPYLDLLGLERITAQLERLILFSYPTLVVVATAVIARTMPGVRVVAALALTYAGLLLLFGRDFGIGGRDVAIGAAMVFGAGAMFAGYVVAGRLLIDRLGSMLFTSIAMIGASVAIIIHVSLAGGFGGIEATPRAVWLIFVIAIPATVVPSYLIAEAIGRIGPSPASIVGGTGPMATSFVAVLVLGEAFTAFHLAGLALAVCGIVLLTTAPSRGG